MLFSNELNYWVIKKNAKKDLLLRMGRHIRTYPKTSFIKAALPRHCHQSSECGPSSFCEKFTMIFLRSLGTSS
ncbi:hypothetical protein [Leptospira borgpetersenii]|uniref:hypothetical protein n=1 Tax=Leptospira borgpetersenii TaxID=174 RepID=UPI00215384FB|nr:hypothetical protein [Leptospira borgpetersenii]UVA64958.1 hypothetical protein LH336_04625 [Leptospira borgpetersenii]